MEMAIFAQGSFCQHHMAYNAKLAFIVAGSMGPVNIHVWMFGLFYLTIAMYFFSLTSISLPF